MNVKPRVAILLSTYNGEKYLPAQLESLKRQTFKDWVLIVRDDRSQDATLEILRNFAKTDSRLQMHEQLLANIGPGRSFGVLLAAARDFDYVFFCDQDDIWLDNKLDVFLQRFGEITTEFGAKTPLLLHSDLEVMSEDQRTLAASFRKRAKLPVQIESPWPLLARNFATGCALGMNQALVRAAVPIAKDALMHDWWVALIASQLGQINYIDASTIRYRQHSKNASGALSEFGLFNKIRKRIFTLSYFRSLMMRRFRQSLALEQHLRSIGQQNKSEALRDFHTEITRGRWQAVKATQKRGISLYSAPRTFFYRLLIGIYQPRIARLITLQNSLLRLS